MNVRSAFLIALLLTTITTLSGCTGLPRVEDRLLSVEYYHVKFKPSSPNPPPQHRNLEAALWRSIVRQNLAQVKQTISAGNVYGDRSAWQPMLATTSSEVTACRAVNNRNKALEIHKLRNASRFTQVLLQSTRLTPNAIPNVGPCTIDPSRQMRALNFSVLQLFPGRPGFDFDLLSVEVGASNEIWNQLDLASSAATFTPATGKGAAQFVFALVHKNEGWEQTFEEVIVVLRGSYLGDADLIES